MRNLAGTRLREQRLALGLRQGDLAQRAGISPAYLNLIEHNRRKVAPALLVRLAEALGVSAHLLSDDSPGSVGDVMMETLAEITAAPVGGAGLEPLTVLVTRSPGWAAWIAQTYRRNQDLMRAIEALNDQMSHDPILPASLHEVLSAATSVQTTAGILAEDAELDAEWRKRFLANLMQDGKRLAEGTRSLASYLENQGRQDEFGLASPLEEAEAWAAAGDWDLSRTGGTEDLSLAAKGLVAKWGAQDMADRAALSEAALIQAQTALGEDPLAIALHLQADVGLVMRRLTLTPGRAAGLILCDGSGTLTLRKPPRGFSVPRFGGSCPLWPLFTALGHPGMAVTQLIRSISSGFQAASEGAGFHAFAYGRLSPGGGFSQPVELRSAAMMLVPARLGDASFARTVGSSCRVCPVDACAARREDSILSRTGGR